MERPPLGKLSDGEVMELMFRYGSDRHIAEFNRRNKPTPKSEGPFIITSVKQLEDEFGLPPNPNVIPVSLFCSFVEGAEEFIGAPSLRFGADSSYPGIPGYSVANFLTGIRDVSDLIYKIPPDLEHDP